MLAKRKVKVAAKRVNANKRAVRNTSKRRTFWARVWNIICWPFRKIAQFLCWLWRKIVQFVRWVWKKICQFCRWLWKVICGINLVGLLNLALLIAIIVLFSMLIIDVMNYRKKPVVIVADPMTVSQTTTAQSVPVVAEPTTKPVKVNAGYIRPRTDVLPIARDTQTNKMAAEPIRVTKQEPNPVTEKQIAKCGEKIQGDIIIENRGDAKLLNNGTEINGNLYLQNMNKYVLPCDIKITGNMFIRDVNMLQFCGDFEITGNIYVSPRSSFGPIPSTARLGGQVIL